MLRLHYALPKKQRKQIVAAKQDGLILKINYKNMSWHNVVHVVEWTLLNSLKAKEIATELVIESFSGSVMVL